MITTSDNEVAAVNACGYDNAKYMQSSYFEKHKLSYHGAPAVRFTAYLKAVPLTWNCSVILFPQGR